MRAKHVTEDPIFKWELNQEAKLNMDETWWQWQDPIFKWELNQEAKLNMDETWWQWQLRDAAAAGLRDYYVRDRSELERLAIRTLEQLGYDIEQIDLDKAVDILERFVQYEEEVNEGSITDVLKPKSKEDIQKYLDQYDAEEKMRAVKDKFMNPEDVVRYLIDAGADEEIFVEVLMEKMEPEQLRQIIRELIPYQQNVIEYFLDYINDEQFDKALKEYFETENPEEVNDVLDILLTKHSIDVGNKRREPHFGNYEDDDDF